MTTRRIQQKLALLKKKPDAAAGLDASFFDAFAVALALTQKRKPANTFEENIAAILCRQPRVEFSEFRDACQKQHKQNIAADFEKFLEAPSMQNEQKTNVASLPEPETQERTIEGSDSAASETSTAADAQETENIGNYKEELENRMTEFFETYDRELVQPVLKLNPTKWRDVLGNLLPECL